ncbi:hypothetical protein A7U60_g5130 [Sanghuangporus baumii]|uniref:Uncharacterized protein n=1 Tax=Sanghuangporus baumii TaxID=108892 RepID=A0A9Q5HXF8_SANBA|nr:hypothetical protein A7U60_g5130 [Sanghuangporus baumii]
MGRMDTSLYVSPQPLPSNLLEFPTSDWLKMQSLHTSEASPSSLNESSLYGSSSVLRFKDVGIFEGLGVQKEL